MGWARANIMFEKAKRVPEPGSPMEIVFILLWKMRQDIEFQKSRATLQALLSQKEVESKPVIEAFDNLREAFFPFNKNQKKSDLKTMRDQLMREVRKGPVSVIPTEDVNKRKVQSRLVRGERDLAKKEAMHKSGKTVDIDSFDKARRRTRRAF